MFGGEGVDGITEMKFISFQSILVLITCTLFWIHCAFLLCFFFPGFKTSRFYMRQNVIK